MSVRYKWVCPGCGTSFSVPSVEGLTLCPECERRQTQTRATVRLKWAAVGLIVTSAVLAVVFGLQQFGGGMGLDKIVPLAQGNPDQKLVLEWLNKNLDDPTVEPVQWWDAVDQDDVLAKQREEYLEWRKKNPDAPNNSVNGPNFHQFAVDPPADRPYPERILRFKFRTKVAGASVLKDMVFAIDNNTAWPVTSRDIVFFATFKQLDTSAYDVYR